ncbi:ankyrin repeat and SOCS box protein 6 [Pleuronectes platessa]|uniref:ankyrin repeat and SOCS box protein 6 n=1 Tax=Pleuronectes platessa TaxID=8262 RepID=UPI00232A0ED0|nr:ankyrin repeat and SOCS box protein 6 [Pleuronectes platessa]XP_053276692.1 ankyrin repeat and SOCS box protein 6 [Pleuronectes platessa]XP_053276693.1 ankyrin repeat and SOCS box protein 6 [Pleuronectes platessa]XP_053276694.1 ankyrin repeat and SOCS box protein 6 [Pleuronectes platessa]XP_053276695.1 ankyrin repeat and SOCS box protein 6 [Pleuronectes platessa]XP_053276696.1 ankyrin repeat and SOCS box protein 6 [Pleuronectes platessa]
MPFLHGFRRIIYEYQPLVDAVMRVVGLEEGGDGDGGGGDGEEDRVRSPEDESGRRSSLVELLERESQSEVFMEGISYALYRVAERGLGYAAEILLRYGAYLNFEDPVSYYNPLHVAVLRNRPNMVKLLVGHGADIEKRDRIHESSPLDLASEESERLPCLLALLDLGADVNASDKNGKTPLLHAMASSDGLTVNNTESIQLLLERGADAKAVTAHGEAVESLLVFLIKEALDASAEDAAEIGKFCLKTTQLLLTHGVDPSCCMNEDGDPSLTQTSLEHFDHFFPLAVLLMQRGAALKCTYHGDSCWSGESLLFGRLQEALQQCSDQSHASELVEQAEVLLDLARVNVPMLPFSSELPAPGQDPHPYAPALVDLQRRVAEHDTSPPALRCLCRAFIRTHLQPWPLEDRVNALPLPDRMKDFILPERTYKPKPGWDCFKPQSS